MKNASLTLGCLILSACGGQGISLVPFENRDASPQSFMVCHGFGCSHSTPLSLREKDWKTAIAPLRKRSKNAAQERERIAQTIARLEDIVQKNGGFVPDRGEATTFENDQHQMDCLDETINTSQYLRFLDEAGLLEFNAVYEPVHRGFFIDGVWPHNSAAVRNLDTNKIYAIDSYYSDNGGEVHVVELSEWLNEWRPEGPFIPPKPGRKPKR